MRALILKVSSLGDIVHTLPAINDASRKIPGIRFDWVIDEAYTDIARWHPAVDRLIEFPHRRWRRHPFQALGGDGIRRLVREVRQERYDCIIDGQGQVGKTMWLAWLARGRTCGMDWNSVREPIVSTVYDEKFPIKKGQHAVERLRQLFARSLRYDPPESQGEYGLDREALFNVEVHPGRLMFLHGTSWVTKEWPETYWHRLIKLASDAGYEIRLTWGDQREHQRAQRLAGENQNVRVLPKLSVSGLARELAACAGAIAVDTGLGHLASALSVPTLSLYGPTSSGLTGTYGASQHYFSADFECAPCLQKRCSYRGASEVEPACFAAMTPGRVWGRFLDVLKPSRPGVTTASA